MKKIVLSLVAAICVAVSWLGVGQMAYADNDICTACRNGDYDHSICEAAGCFDQATTAPGVAVNIINIVLGVIGVAGVFVVVVGGIMYVVSAGSVERMNMGKNLILYGVIGLVIALLASAVVNFVIWAVFGNA